MNIDELRLSLFASPKSYSGKLVPLSEIVRMIRYDDILRERTLQYRDIMAAMGKKTANKNIKERLVHAFSVAVTFKGLGHSSEQASQWTGIAMCDIDQIDDPTDVETAFDRLTHDPHVLLMYRTISGKGLRVLYRYQREGGQRIDDTSWRAAFVCGNEQLSSVAGYDYDKACSDYTRLSGMASDSRLYYNPEATPYTIPDDLIVTENCDYQEHGRPRKVYQPGTNTTEPEQAWQRIQSMLAEKGLLWEPHHHHDYVLHASYLFNRFGVPLDKLLPWASQEWGDYDGHEREAAIRHKYKDEEHFGTWKLNRPSKGRENAMITLPEIRQWLAQHYSVLYNQVTDQMFYQQKDDDSWQQLTAIVINTFRGRMAEDTGKRVLTGDVRSVIESDYARQVHPVRAYILQLPDWDGKDRVAELSAHVHAQATSVLSSDDEAQQLFHWALHKWLVAMVATWMSDQEGNQEILTLIGPQGIYKTTFFRHILPPPLHEYFWENAHNSFRSKDDKIALTENCLVEIEEVEAIDGADMAELKALATSLYVKERRPYAVYREQKARLASFCATGNLQKILTDKTGTRRWLCHLVSSIDNPREWQLDYEQLYAQLYQEYQAGFRYYLTKDEELQLERRNMPFRRVSPEEELITSRLRKPVGNETCKLMNATMIAVFLTGGVNHGLNVHKISEVMRSLQFASRSRGGYDYFRVVEIPFEQQQGYIAQPEADVFSRENSEAVKNELDLPF